MRRFVAGKAPEEAGERLEKVVWRGKPVILAFYDGLLGGVLLLVVSFFPLSFPGFVWLSLLGLLCGALLIVLAYVKARANTYSITEKHVIREYRFIVTRVDEAALDKVTDIVVEQGILGRVFNFGNLRFDTAGTLFQGVIFEGVKNPYDVKKIADKAFRAGEESNSIKPASRET